MKTIFKLLFCVVFLGFSSQSYGQEEYGAGVPGADNYEGKCRIDYVNAYRDGKACGDGNESFCGIIQPTNSPECKAAQLEGYAAGYEAGKIPAPNGDRDIYYPQQRGTWYLIVGPDTKVSGEY